MAVNTVSVIVKWKEEGNEPKLSCEETGDSASP
jgi:hypothetical protein